MITRHHYCVILFIACIAGELLAERIIVDEMRAVVYHEDGARIILSSDIKPDLDGQQHTLRDVVLEELMLIEADHFHITVTKDDAEDYVAELQKTNHMSRAAMERLMEDMGYSYDQGLEKMRRRQTIEQLIDFRVRSDKRFIINREDVEKFEAEHPVFEQAVYTLAQVVVQDQNLSGEALAKSDALEKKYSQKELDALAWEESFDLHENEVAEDKKFLVDAPLGSVVDREEVDGGVELTRLVARTPRRRVSVDELYDQVVNRIRLERFGEVMKDFQKTILDTSTIRFTHPQDKIAVFEHK